MITASSSRSVAHQASELQRNRQFHKLWKRGDAKRTQFVSENTK